MLHWLKTLDRILRGEATRPETIQQGKFDLPIGGLLIVIIALAMIYGLCMGSFSLFKEVDPSQIPSGDRYLQVLASTVKVPALFFLTLLITFPSLYVFNALVGSRLDLAALLQLLIAALGVNLAVLASLGPIVAFFSISTTSYGFMVLFNVVIFSVAGLLGLLFLMQTLNRMSQRSVDGDKGHRVEADPPAGDANEPSEEGTEDPDEHPAESGPAEVITAALAESPGALDMIEGHVLGQHVKTVFRLWVVVFGLVGAQMGWVLRPFIGDPEMQFTWFRVRESNFFEAVLRTLVNLITGG